MLLITFAPLLASALLAESVGPVGTPGAATYFTGEFVSRVMPKWQVEGSRQ